MKRFKTLEEFRIDRFDLDIAKLIISGQLKGEILTARGREVKELFFDDLPEGASFGFGDPTRKYSDSDGILLDIDDPDSPLKIEGCSFFTAKPGEWFKKGDKVIQVREKLVPGKVLAAISVEGDTIEYDAKISDFNDYELYVSMFEMNSQVLWEYKQKVSESTGFTKFWDDMEMALHDLPKPGDVIWITQQKYYKSNPDVLGPSQVYHVSVKALVSEVGEDGIKICARFHDSVLTLENEWIPLEYRGECRFIEEDPEFMSALREEGYKFTRENGLEKLEIPKIEFGDLVLVKAVHNVPWEVGQFAFLEEDSGMCHIFGGIAYKYWMPYLGNEKYLGK